MKNLNYKIIKKLEEKEIIMKNKEKEIIMKNQRNKFICFFVGVIFGVLFAIIWKCVFCYNEGEGKGCIRSSILGFIFITTIILMILSVFL